MKRPKFVGGVGGQPPYPSLAKLYEWYSDEALDYKHYWRQAEGWRWN